MALWAFPAFWIVGWLDRKQVDAGRWGTGTGRVVPWTAIESFSASYVNTHVDPHLRSIWANCGSAIEALRLGSCNWSEPTTLAIVTALTREFIEAGAEFLSHTAQLRRPLTELAEQKRQVLRPYHHEGEDAENDNLVEAEAWKHERLIPRAGTYCARS